jgi:aspartyl protease family protein
LVLVLCAIGTQAVYAMPDIRVHGFFGKSAVLVINDKQRLLKQGETSPEGVTLISTANSEAVLEVEGQRVTLGMSQHISSNFHAADVAEVRIPRGRNGHYFVTGYIDGHAMEFMVDTGASVVALNINQAKALGLDYRNGESIRVSTASGVAEAREVTLNKLTIGNITLYNIRCIVHIGSHPRIALLGNSFLSHVQMSDVDGVLLLRKKF